VWTNLGSEKSKPWLGYFTDVIAIDFPGAARAHLVEVDTADSVTRAEAATQWQNSTWLLRVAGHAVARFDFFAPARPGGAV
jgi:hypothetical protein